MDKTLNEKILRFVGKSSMNPKNELQLGEDKKIMIEGSIINVIDKDNQDGTFDREYVIKIITAEIQ